MLIRPAILLRLEGALMLLVALWGYHHVAGSWLLFFLLFLVPDLSMLGYIANPRLGARCYNAIHTLLLPLALCLYGVLIHQIFSVQIGLIWIAHIEFDRLLGFGLKYPDAFKDTHLHKL